MNLSRDRLALYGQVVQCFPLLSFGGGRHLQEREGLFEGDILVLKKHGHQCANFFGALVTTYAEDSCVSSASARETNIVVRDELSAC